MKKKSTNGKKQQPKKSNKKNNGGKVKKEKANSSKSRNATKPKPSGKTNKRGLATKKVKKAVKKKKKAIKKPKLTALQKTRRVNKWKKENISRGRYKNYTKDITEKIISLAVSDIAQERAPDMKSILDYINSKYLKFTESTYQVSSDSLKTLIRARAYQNKKIKTIGIFNDTFETKFNEVAIEICEDNSTYFWMIIDRIRKQHTVKSPVFLPFVTERKQNGNINKKTGKTPRVLKIDFSKDESVNGVNLELWQKFKEILKKQIRH